MGVRVCGSARALLAGLIDYAGLFPPAGLSMEAAVASYARYRMGEHAWMLGRFVVPAARLEELDRCLPPGGAGGGWRISALVGDDLNADLERIHEWTARRGSGDRPLTPSPLHPLTPSPPHPLIDSAEAKAATPEQIARLAPLVAAGLETFVEVPLIDDLRPLLASVRGIGARAKIRAGGLAAGAFPEPQALAGFIAACAGMALPFKATAGLHHPLRGVHPFTYEEGSPRGLMHGFLNVFLGAAFARMGMDPSRLAALLEETRPEAFRFDDEGVAWQGRRIGTEGLHAARQELALSFGSCSFEEPVADLRELGLL